MLKNLCRNLSRAGVSEVVCMVKFWLFRVALAPFGVVPVVACGGEAAYIAEEPVVQVRATETARQTATRALARVRTTRPPTSAPVAGEGRWSSVAVELAMFLRDVARSRTDPELLNCCYSVGGPHAGWATCPTWMM